MCMNRLFEDIDNYINTSSTNYFGHTTKEDNIRDILTGKEYEIYESIKERDRKRLLYFG